MSCSEKLLFKGSNLSPLSSQIRTEKVGILASYHNSGSMPRRDGEVPTLILIIIDLFEYPFTMIITVQLLHFLLKFGLGCWWGVTVVMCSIEFEKELPR